MDNECYEGTILSNALNEMKKRKCCCPRYIPGPTGPTARCNKSSIYFFK